MLRKRRLFFIIARIIGIFFIGLAVAIVIALSQVNLETLRGDLLNVLQDSTGLPIEIDGNVSWKFSLRPRVELNDVRIPNAVWAKEKNGFVAKKIDVTLNLISLLRDRPTIQSVRIYDSTLYLEKNDKGEFSIQSDKEVQEDKKTESDTSPKNAKYPFEDPGLGSVELRNTVAHIEDQTYYLTGFSLSYNRSNETREYTGWLKLDTKVYPFILSFSEYNAERKIYPMRIALSTGGEALVANIALEGTSKIPIDFTIKGNIPNIAELGNLFGVPFPEIPMININLAGGFDYNKLTLRKSTLTVRGSDLTISGSVNWGSKIPVYDIKLNSKKFDLVEVFPTLYGNGRKWIRPDRPLNVFKDIPLYGKELLGHDLKLVVKVDQFLIYRDLHVSDTSLNASLHDGKLRANLKSKIAEGEITLGLNVDAASDGMLTVEAAGLGERVYLGEILKMLGETDYITELPLNMEFYLQGHGDDLSHLMSSVTGPIFLYSVAPGYAHSKLVSYMYGTDFLTSLRHSIQDLFRSNKKNDQIKISCATINLKVRDGIIETENGVAAETNAINVRLAGTVDLGDESMKVSLMTVPVRGLKISLTGNVVNAIEITGNLAEPDIKISGSAVASKVASATGIGLLLAPFTGGIGLVAGAGVGWLAGDLIENWLADDHPCRTARKSGAPVLRHDPEWMALPMAELVGRIIK